MSNKLRFFSSSFFFRFTLRYTRKLIKEKYDLISIRNRTKKIIIIIQEKK